MDQPEFLYRRLGESLRNDLCDLIFSRRSSVLLGVRHVGKSHFLRTIAERIGQDSTMLPIVVSFPHHPVLARSDDVREVVNSAVRRMHASNSAPSAECDTPATDGDLLGRVRALCDGDRRRTVVLLASNLDSLSQQMSHRFLREARTLVQNHCLVAVLTGEGDLRDLVYGPDSEFNCTEQFVVQGLDEGEFGAIMRQRSEFVELDFANAKDALADLYERSGGNAHLARASLWVWQERRFHHVGDHERPSQRQPSSPVSRREFQEFLNSDVINQMAEMGVFQDFIRVVRRSKEAWKDLQCLKAQPAGVDVFGNQPSMVELAGMAVRQKNRLRFASPWTESFVKSYFDDCRLGDLHAIEGDWTTALSHYRSMPAERRERPNSAEDRAQLGQVVSSLCAKLHAIAAEQEVNPTTRLDWIKQLFFEGVGHLLGISRVTFWRHDQTWRNIGTHGSAEEIEQSEERRTTDALLFERAILSQLNPSTKIIAGPRQSGDVVDRAAALLPSTETGGLDAIVLSTAPHPERSFTKERCEILKHLLGQFSSAYEHAVSTWRAQLRLQARARHLKVAVGIVNALGRSVRNPLDALQEAGDQLLKLGYRRIMFSLVDPARQRIRGISYRSAPGASAPLQTDYVLSDPYADIQPWVVRFKQPIVVPNWRQWHPDGKFQPKINVEQCEKVGMGPFAVVPMLIESSHGAEDVYGTIHVEPLSLTPPSNEELEDLLEFGRLLASVVNQSERINSLLMMLHCNRDSVVLLDQDQSVRFVNAAAARHLKLDQGWHETSDETRLGSAQPEEASQIVAQTVAEGKRKVRHVTRAAGEGQVTEEFVCELLPDWRRRHDDVWHDEADKRSIVGVMLTVRDLTSMRRIFKSLRSVASEAMDFDTAALTLLRETDKLQFGRPRLYRVNPVNPNELISFRAIGLDEPVLRIFEKGGYSMPRTAEEHDDTWWAIDHREPRVFQWDPQRPPNSTTTTLNGLIVHNVAQPRYESDWKAIGDTWIDIPLVAHSHVFGKLAIDCGSGFRCDLKPEDFELLSLFSALNGALLDALYRKDRWINEASEKAIGQCAHTMKTQLAPLLSIGREYASAAPDNADVATLNAIVDPAIERCYRAVKRIHEIFGRSITLHRADVRLGDLLEKVGAGERAPQKRNYRMRNPPVRTRCPRDVTASLDEDCMVMVFDELIDNSLQMADPAQDLQVDIEVRQADPGDTLEIIVSDNGPGVSAEYANRIFEPLFSHRPNGELSTGIGLNLVRRIVEAHGGRIILDQGVNRGASFKMSFDGAICSVRQPANQG